MNCGGRLDLQEKLEELENDRLKILLLDSQRPIHHNNLDNDYKRIILVDDKTIDMKNCPSQADLMLLDDEVEEEKDNDEELDEFFDEVNKNRAENVLNVNGMNKEEKQEEETVKEENQQEIVEKEEVQEEKKAEPVKLENKLQDDEEEIDMGKKRAKRKQDEKKNRKRVQAEIQKKIEKYYDQNYFGDSIARIMYKLCQQLNKEDSSLLWYWILGETDNYTSFRVSQKVYEMNTKHLESEVIRMNVHSKSGRSNFFSQNNKNRKARGIYREKCLNLFMLEHWNLHDALLNSNCSIPKLKTWNDNGKFKLKQMVARMGIPLTEATQKYMHLNPKHKNDIVNKMQYINKDDSQLDISISTFIRIIDSKHQYSSLDMCEIINYILNCPYNFNERVLKLNEESDKKDAMEGKLMALNLEDNFYSVFLNILNM